MAEHDMASADLRDAHDEARYNRLEDMGGPAAAEYLCSLWAGDEWNGDGDVNFHEIADQLEAILPALREVYAPFPNGWNPAAKTTFRYCLLELEHRMHTESKGPINGAMRMVGDIPQYWADSLKRWVTIPDD